jgi:flagellar protein FlaI
LDESNILFIECPSPKCDGCSKSRIYDDCRILKEQSEMSDTAILFDTENHQMYIRGLSLQCPSDFEFKNWKTIYLDPDFDALIIKKIEDVYCVGPYIVVYYLTELDVINYVSIPIIHTRLESGLINSLMERIVLLDNVRTGIRRDISERLVDIKLGLEHYLSEDLPEIAESNRKRIVELAAYKSSLLCKLFPLLLDDRVEEIYLDKPQSFVYFDHQKHGRCKTAIRLNQEDITRIVTLLRAESNLHLDRKNPSLKTDISLFDVALRVAVSLPPLAADGFHLEIRRAKTKPLTLYDLIENGTLSINAAATLLFALFHRFNITITGAPGTGKTTLLNALDLLAPKEWRKVYIEDAIESRINKGQHQVRVRVDPVDETAAKTSKKTEIIKSLHRSPDYLVLGEIQTAEHSQALFQAISAGIRTIQTCHSDSASSLVSRWRASHIIEDQSIALMDVIVVLDRPEPGKSFRRVIEISEVRRKMIDGITSFQGLNRIFNVNDTQEAFDRWLKDGAFRTRIEELGIESPMDVFSHIAENIRMELEGMASRRTSFTQLSAV